MIDLLLEYRSRMKLVVCIQLSMDLRVRRAAWEAQYWGMPVVALVVYCTVVWSSVPLLLEGKLLQWGHYKGRRSRRKMRAERWQRGTPEPFL